MSDPTQALPLPRFGLYLPQLRMDLATIEARVGAAAEAGFDSVWFMDHLAPPAAPQWDCLEGWTLASAIGARCPDIRLGHLVLCDPLRHPALLAKMAATLDVICDGRLELGLGWGSVESELVRYGFGAVPAAERAARLKETLQILELMFSGQPFSFEGRYFRLHDAVGRPTPVQGRVPIHLGGAGVRLTMPLVAAHADWWNCPAYGVDALDRLLPLAGRARVSVQHPVGLAPSAAARAEVEELTRRRFGGWGGVVIGTPEEVAAQLSAEVARGVDMFVVQLHDFAQPQTLQLFAKEVIPQVRGCGPAGRPQPPPST